MKNYEKVMKKNPGKDYFFIMYLPDYDYIYTVAVRYLGRNNGISKYPWQMCWFSKNGDFSNTAHFSAFTKDGYRECLGEL